MKIQVILQTIDEKNGNVEIVRNYDQSFFDTSSFTVGEEIKEMAERILPKKKDEPIQF